MKPRTARLARFALAIAMVVTLFLPKTAFAAVNYQFKTLNPNVTAKESYKYNGTTGIHYTYYTIKVAKRGQLAFTLSSDGYVYLYNSKTDIANQTHKYSYKSINYRSESKSVSVEAGTYYLQVSDGTAKYKFYAAPSAPNYCSAKATKLTLGKATKVMLTPKTNYARWYKVSLTTAKKIAYRANTATGATSIEIYNARMQRLETIKNGSDVKYITKNKLPKGTYYIRVKSQSRYYSDNDYAFGTVFTFVAK